MTQKRPQAFWVECRESLTTGDTTEVLMGGVFGLGFRVTRVTVNLGK